MDQDHTGTANHLAPEGASTTNENKSETPNQTTVEPVPPATPATDPITPPSAPVVPSTKPNSPKGLIATVIIFAILATAGTAFGIYGMFLQPKPTCEANCTNPISENADNNSQDDGVSTADEETYQLSDYASISEVSVPVTYPSETEKGHTQDVIKKIELTNLPQNTIASFSDIQEQLITRSGSHIVSRSNTAGVAISDNILSAYSIFEFQGEYGKTGSVVTLNYDLKADNELSNKELIARYDLTGEDVCEAILEQLVKNVTTDSFLLATDGNITAPTISVADFANNITEYKRILANSPDLVDLYIDEGGGLHALYQQYQILEALGMSSHMGTGLSAGVQDVAI